MSPKERRNKKRNPQRKQQTKYINEDQNISQIKRICAEFKQENGKKLMRESMETIQCAPKDREAEAQKLVKTPEQTKLEQELSKPMDFDAKHLVSSKTAPPKEVVQEARLSLGPDGPLQSDSASVRGCAICIEETKTTSLFDTKKALKDHEWEIHRKVRCPTCRKACKNMAEAHRCHGKKPDDLKGQLCDGCGKRFKKQSEYRKHKHPRTGKPCGLVCKVDGCQHIEKTIWDMDLHRNKVHGGSKPRNRRLVRVSAGSKIDRIKAVRPAQLRQVLSTMDISKGLGPQFNEDGTPKYDLFMHARGDTVQALIEYSIQVDAQASHAQIHAIRSAKLHQEDVPHLVKEFFNQMQLKRATKVLLSFTQQSKDYFQWMGFHKSGLKQSSRRALTKKVKGSPLINAVALLDNCLWDYTPKMEYSDRLPQCDLADELERTLARLRGLNFENLVATEMAVELKQFMDEVTWAELKDSWSTPPELIDYIADKLIGPKRSNMF